jgi:D-glycero-D-manno-heptose 1,7-bisphosphate phosphatase
VLIPKNQRMSDKLLLLDLDGTVRQSRSNPAGFIDEPNNQEVIPGADLAIERYASQDWRMVGITNQGGVGAGYKTLGQCLDEQLRTLALVPELDAIFFCPAHPAEIGHLCYEIDRIGNITTYTGRWAGFEGYRKPNPSMLRLAIDAYGKFSWDGGENLCVGDRPEDEEAARRAGVAFLSAEAWRESSPPILSEN